MSRPVRDAGEDRESFELRYAEWRNLQDFQRAARRKVRGLSEVSEGMEIELTQVGAWVPVQVFVSWKQAGIDPADFDLEDEP